MHVLLLKFSYSSSAMHILQGRVVRRKLVGCLLFTIVVYFDQRTGAPHAVCWSKSYILALKQVFHFFLSQWKKRKKIERKAQKITRKTWWISRELTSVCISTSFEEKQKMEKNTVVGHFHTFFSDFSCEITKKGLKRRKKLKTAEKSVLTSFRVHAANDPYARVITHVQNETGLV